MSPRTANLAITAFVVAMLACTNQLGLLVLVVCATATAFGVIEAGMLLATITLMLGLPTMGPYGSIWPIVVYAIMGLFQGVNLRWMMNHKFWGA